MVQTLPLRTSITPAMVIGPWFDLAVNIAALILLFAAVVFGFTNRARRRT
jgi:hypothetical protein